MGSKKETGKDLDLRERVSRLMRSRSSAAIALAFAGLLIALSGTAVAKPQAGPLGPAGGALTGTYPDPLLNVTGGPCANGQALIDISSLAVLTCAPGVYSDADNNVAAGPTAFPALTPGGDGGNTAVGAGVLGQNTTGWSNSGLGFRALEQNSTGYSNNAFGSDALQKNTIGYYNAAFGGGALQYNTEGNQNSAFGQYALLSNTTGFGNSAVGHSALSNNTTGGTNSAVGFTALQGNTTGQANSALGGFALGNNTIAGGNSAVGWMALASNTEGPGNSALGNAALQHNTTGSQNAALGGLALAANDTGNNNVALGASSLFNNTTGANNVALGVNAGGALTSGNNNIDIGAGVAGTAGESNTIRIGSQGTQTAAYLAGVSGTNLGAVPNVVVNANGQLGVNASSERFKTDIQPLRSLDGLMKLKPVSFRYRAADVDGPNPTEFGLLAEQVAKVYPNLVSRGKDGKPYTVLYQQLPSLLLAKVQQQQRQNDSLRAQNRSQQAQIDWLMSKVRGR